LRFGAGGDLQPEELFKQAQNQHNAACLLPCDRSRNPVTACDLTNFSAMIVFVYDFLKPFFSATHAATSSFL
jgi:hypothetical protein